LNQQLESYDGNVYTYDADGLRTSKTVNNVKTEYTWVNGKLIGQKTGTDTLYFLYNGDEIIGFNHNSDTYFYLKNLQNDVTGIVDSNGNVVASYSYDAWGKVLTSTGTLAEINPMRYRSYYYDTDISMYYLQSRYYNPSVGRFLNFDEVMILYRTVDTLSGTNGFAYCDNDAVNGRDPTGYFKPEMHFDQTYDWGLEFFKYSKPSRIKKDYKNIAWDIAYGNESVDGGDFGLDGTGPLRIWDEEAQSWHFNTNIDKKGNPLTNKYTGEPLEDSRLIHLDKQLDIAKDYMKTKAESDRFYLRAAREVGIGLHAGQDIIAHVDGWKDKEARAAGATSNKTIFGFHWHLMSPDADTYHECDLQTYKCKECGIKNCKFAEKFCAAAIVTGLTFLYYETLH
jgi:RHS repeat-associated protein